MPVSSVVRERVRELLGPGERLRYVFPADIPHSFTPGMLIAVTDRSISVIATGYLRRTTPKSVHARYNRNVRIGPVETDPVPLFHLDGIDYEVDDEYIPVINAVDAELDPANHRPTRDPTSASRTLNPRRSLTVTRRRMASRPEHRH